VKVIIPVAGIGTRLRPHTHTAPKALLYVAGQPLLGHILDSLKNIEFDQITFIIGFLGEQIVDYVTKNFNFNARFVDQKELHGLGYAIDLGLDENETDDILVLLGDTIIETDWDSFIGQGKNLIGVKRVKDPRRFGMAEVNGDRITRVWEKPENPLSNLALVGIYYIRDTPLFKKCLMELIDSDIKTRNEYQVTDAIQIMLDKGGEIHAREIDGWYDCGKAETLLETNHHLLDECQECAPRIPGSVVIPPVFIDPTAKIENSIIGPFASIASSAVIKNSIIVNSIIALDAHVSDSILKNSLIGDHASVKGHFEVLNVGDSSEVGY